MDGTGQETLLAGQNEPTGIALDVPANKIYWTNQTAPGEIRSANLDGTGQETLLQPIAPYGLALDVSADKMYWTGGSFGQDILRANLDGSGQQILVAGQNSPTGIALDIAGGKMYWSNQFGNTIWRSNLDGTGQQILLTGLTEPIGMALDVAAGKIYWADFGGSIRRAACLTQSLNDSANRFGFKIRTANPPHDYCQAHRNDTRCNENMGALTDGGKESGALQPRPFGVPVSIRFTVRESRFRNREACPGP